MKERLKAPELRLMVLRMIGNSVSLLILLMLSLEKTTNI